VSGARDGAWDGGPVNSHVEVAEVDGGADEARGGVVAGALAREAQPPPRRQRPLHRPAPPPAHSPRPDVGAARQQSSRAGPGDKLVAQNSSEIDEGVPSYVHGQVAEGRQEGEDVREEVDGEPLDVRLHRAAVAVVLALLLRVHLSPPSASSLARRAQKLGKARRGRLLVGRRQVATLAPPMRAARRDTSGRGRRGMDGIGLRGGQVSRLCGHRRAIPRQIIASAGLRPVGMLRPTVTKSGPGSNLQRLGYAYATIKLTQKQKKIVRMGSARVYGRFAV
jgi:hypothetical protein